MLSLFDTMAWISRSTIPLITLSLRPNLKNAQTSYPLLTLEEQHMNKINVCIPGVQSFKDFVAGLLFRAADSWISCCRQSHGTQHQRGDGLNRQYIYLSPLQILLRHKQTHLMCHTQYPKPMLVFLARFKWFTSCWVSSSWSIVIGWVTSTPNRVAHVSSNCVRLLQPARRPHELIKLFNNHVLHKRLDYTWGLAADRIKHNFHLTFIQIY